MLVSVISCLKPPFPPWWRGSDHRPGDHRFSLGYFNYLWGPWRKGNITYIYIIYIYIIYNITILGIWGICPHIYKFHAGFSITVYSMAPKKCEHHDSPVNSSVSVSWTVKLFDYPGAVKVWLYQVVSIIYQIHLNSLFCIGSLMELGIKFPNHMIVEVLVYSSGLSCEKMCSTLQYHLRMMQRSTKSVWILATIRRWAMNFIWSPNWMSMCPLFHLGSRVCGMELFNFQWKVCVGFSGAPGTN